MVLTRTTPGKAGISPKAVSAFLSALKETSAGAHSFMLIRHGQVAAEGWWKPYAPEKPHMLFSLSKSFTSTAVGFAVQERRLTVEDDVLSFFEGELPSPPCENMRKMKIKHLLTMNTGHTAEPNVFDGKAPWTTAFLTSYIPLAPGTKFVYNTPATYMLSAIVQKVTGEKLIDYLKPRLLDPLGIQGAVWQESPQGINTGGFGLSIKTEDIARFGVFLLNRGNVDGVSLIDPKWIDEATGRRVSNGNPEDGSDWSQGYGYQFWRCVGEGVYRGDGAFGQYCVVMPKQDAVLAMTSGSGDIGNILKQAWKHLLPAMEDAPVADDGLDALYKQIAGLGVALPAGEKTKPGAEAVRGAYHMSDNAVGLRVFALEWRGETPVLTARFHERESVTPLGYGRWAESGEGDAHCAAAYAWLGDGRMEIRIVNDATPFIQTVRARFENGYVNIELRQNVGFEDVNCDLIGRRGE